MSVLVSFTDEDAHAHLFAPDLLEFALTKKDDALQIIHWMPELPLDQRSDAARTAAMLLKEAVDALDEYTARVPAVPLGGCDR